MPIKYRILTKPVKSTEWYPVINLQESRTSAVARYWDDKEVAKAFCENDLKLPTDRYQIIEEFVDD